MDLSCLNLLNSKLEHTLRAIHDLPAHKTAEKKQLYLMAFMQPMGNNGADMFDYHEMTTIFKQNEWHTANMPDIVASNFLQRCTSHDLEIMIARKYKHCINKMIDMVDHGTEIYKHLDMEMMYYLFGLNKDNNCLLAALVEYRKFDYVQQLVADYYMPGGHCRYVLSTEEITFICERAAIENNLEMLEYVMVKLQTPSLYRIARVALGYSKPLALQSVTRLLEHHQQNWPRELSISTNFFAYAFQCVDHETLSDHVKLMNFLTNAEIMTRQGVSKCEFAPCEWNSTKAVELESVELIGIYSVCGIYKFCDAQVFRAFKSNNRDIVNMLIRLNMEREPAHPTDAVYKAYLSHHGSLCCRFGFPATINSKLRKIIFCHAMSHVYDDFSVQHAGNRIDDHPGGQVMVYTPGRAPDVLSFKRCSADFIHAVWDDIREDNFLFNFIFLAVVKAEWMELNILLRDENHQAEIVHYISDCLTRMDRNTLVGNQQFHDFIINHSDKLDQRLIAGLDIKNMPGSAW